MYDKFNVIKLLKFCYKDPLTSQHIPLLQWKQVGHLQG